LKKIIRKIIDKIAAIFGYYRTSRQSVYNNKNDLLTIFYNNIIETGFSPKCIVDVGANTGTWTRTALKFFPTSTYYLIEPQQQLSKNFEDLLKQNSISFYPIGLGDKEGKFRFTLVDRDDSCSFRFTEEEAIKNGFEQIDVPVTTLNKLIQSKQLLTPDIIKIDAEGLDIEVLNGASDFFGVTEVFLIEASIRNKDFNNTIQTVINFMDEKGYNIFEITDLNRPWSNKLLWLVEIAFVKKEGIIDSYNFVNN